MKTITKVAMIAIEDIERRTSDAISKALFSPFSSESPVKSKSSAKLVRWLQKQVVLSIVERSSETLQPKVDH